MTYPKPPEKGEWLILRQSWFGPDPETYEHRKHTQRVLVQVHFVYRNGRFQVRDGGGEGAKYMVSRNGTVTSGSYRGFCSIIIRSGAFVRADPADIPQENPS